MCKSYIITDNDNSNDRRTRTSNSDSQPRLSTQTDRRAKFFTQTHSYFSLRPRAKHIALSSEHNISWSTIIMGNYNRKLKCETQQLKGFNLQKLEYGCPTCPSHILLYLQTAVITIICLSHFFITQSYIPQLNKPILYSLYSSVKVNGRKLYSGEKTH